MCTSPEIVKNDLILSMKIGDGSKTFHTEIQKTDWLAAVVQNSVDHDVENHVLKTIQ